MAVIAKVVHTSLIGFVLGAGFSLFTYMDDGVRVAGRSPQSRSAASGITVSTTSRPALRAALVAACAEGGRTACIIGAATAAMGSIAFARHGRDGTSDKAIWADPLAVGGVESVIAKWLLSRLHTRFHGSNPYDCKFL